MLFAYTAGIECPPAHEGKAAVLLTVVVRLLALEASSAVMRVGEAMIAARSAVAAQGFGGLHVWFTHMWPHMVSHVLGSDGRMGEGRMGIKQGVAWGIEGGRSERG